MTDTVDVMTIEISKLELMEGDVLLVRMPPISTPQDRDRAHSGVQEALRRADIRGITVLIGTTDIQFEIIRKDAA